MEKNSFEYNIHATNTDDHGDSVIGVSRQNMMESGIILPELIFYLELTDIPQPVESALLIVPSKAEIDFFAPNHSEPTKSDETVSFIELFGGGEEIALSEVTAEIVSFVTTALDKRRNHKLEVTTDLFEVEEDAIDRAQQAISKVTDPQSGRESAYGDGYGMYL